MVQELQTAYYAPLSNGATYCTNEYKIDSTLQRQTKLQKRLKPLVTTKA